MMSGFLTILLLMTFTLYLVTKEILMDIVVIAGGGSGNYNQYSGGGGGAGGVIELFRKVPAGTHAFTIAPTTPRNDQWSRYCIDHCRNKTYTAIGGTKGSSGE